MGRVFEDKYINHLEHLLEKNVHDDTIPDHVKDGFRRCLEELQKIAAHQKSDREVANLEEE